MERLWRNVKHEDVYLKGYAAISELLIGLTEYFVYYNTARPHQSLSYLTPDRVYRTASGGGAKIVDKYYEKRLSGHPSATEETHSEIETKTEDRGSAVPLQLKVPS